MPFTPFHLGPGVLLKAAAPRHFSLCLYAAAQGIIDLEPFWYMTQGEWHLHRHLHTYPGATLAGLAAFLIGRPLCGLFLDLWERRRLFALPRPGAHRRIPVIPALVGALLGAWSHVALDSLMHGDIRPLAPISGQNGLLYLVSMERLYLLCAVAGVAGAAIWWWRERASTAAPKSS